MADRGFNRNREQDRRSRDYERDREEDRQRFEQTGSSAGRGSRLNRYSREEDYGRRYDQSFGRGEGYDNYRRSDYSPERPTRRYQGEQDYGWQPGIFETYSDYGFETQDWQPGPPGRQSEYGYTGPEPRGYNQPPGRGGLNDERESDYDRWGARRQGDYNRGLDYPGSSDYPRGEQMDRWGGYGRQGGYNRERAFGYPGPASRGLRPGPGRGLAYQGGYESRSEEYWNIPGPFTGQGPGGYQRSDERIRENVCERLTRHGQVDAREIEVEVENGEVILRGEVQDRRSKRIAEDAVETVMGVQDVHNELRIRRNRPGMQAGQGQPTQTEMDQGGTSAGSQQNDSLNDE